nr:phage tail protein [Citrobacter sp. CRE-46]
MLRIGQVEATATQDGKYTDGSVAGGIAATRLRAAAFNATQEELAHIVESAGLALDINDMTQVLKAIQKLTLSRANPFADIKADGAGAVSTALANLGLSSFADKAAETKQTFSYTVQAKYGYEVLSAAGEIVAALYADNRSAYLHSVSGKPVTIPDKAGTMALVDDLKAGLPPIGIPFFWPQAAMPNTVVDEWSQMVFLKMNDTTFSATQYPILAKVWPGLKLTDSRGEFIRINDDGRGIDAGRALLSAQGDAIRNITGGLGFVPMVGNVDVYGAFTVGGSQNIVNLGVDGNPTTIAQSMYFEAAKSGVPVAAENRPRNITFNLVVRAK